MSVLFLLSLLGAGALASLMGGQNDVAPDDGDDAPDAPDARSPDPQPRTQTATASNTLSGTSGPDDLSATGTDILRGRGGADTLAGYDDADISGDGGRDLLNLFDRATGNGGIGADTITATDDSSAFGGTGNDAITATNGATAQGGSGDDLISWYETDDTPADRNLLISGGEGDDTLSGWSHDQGEVTLSGGRGRDLLVAGDGIVARGALGADTLVGGGGSVLTGGSGGDLFIASPLAAFGNPDDDITVTDFAKGRDTLAVHLIAPPARIDLSESGGNTRLTIDWTPENPSAPSSTSIVVKGVTGLTLDDFDFVTDARQTANPDGTGYDWETAPPLDNLILGTAGADTITAPSGTSLIVTAGGNDSVTAGADSAEGLIALGSGNDTYTATGATTDLSTGAGDDTVTYTFAPPATAPSEPTSFNTGAGNDTVTIDTATTNAGSRFGDLQINLGNGDDTLTIDRDTASFISVFDGAGNDSISLWMGHQAVMHGPGEDDLTLGITADHLANRDATQIIDIGQDDRIVIEVEAGVTGDLTFVQSPSTDTDPQQTAVLLDGKEIAVFVNTLITANDPRITIVRDATFA